MTLEEAIAHHKWAVENSNGEVRDEHMQYVEWLGLTKLARDYVIYEIQELSWTVLERNELHRENGRLRAENAKLRELAKNIVYIDKSCEACEVMDECHQRTGRWLDCLYKERAIETARELGVEV